MRSRRSSERKKDNTKPQRVAFRLRWKAWWGCRPPPIHQDGVGRRVDPQPRPDGPPPTGFRGFPYPPAFRGVDGPSREAPGWPSTCRRTYGGGRGDELRRERPHLRRGAGGGSELVGGWGWPECVALVLESEPRNSTQTGNNTPNRTAAKHESWSHVRQ